MDIVGKKVAAGKIYDMSNEISVNAIDWAGHPSFHGVFLKHLVRGDKTNHQFSYHLVKIEAGCEIGLHIHSGKWELHEVVAGNGVAFCCERKMIYQPGVTSILPADTEHRVVAEGSDLYLLATFVPALV